MSDRPMSERPWLIVPAGLVVTVRLTPKGGRDEVGGIQTLADGHVVLKARVRAAPIEGQANAALIALIAKTLDVARSKVTLAAGESARIKRIAIEGDGKALAARLERTMTG
jgi:uncharacterized protein (TIGR00251 family)